MNECEWILQNTSLFAGVSRDTLNLMLSHDGSRRLQIEKGGVLLKRGGPNNDLILILKGKAEARKGKMPLRMFVPGDVTGVSTLFGDNESMESDITASSRLEVQLFPREAVREALRADAAFAENYIGFLSSRIRFLSGVISRCAGADPADRAAGFLYELSKEKGNCFRLNASRAATTLDMSRATFYRGLAALEQRGLIRREEGKIVILDEMALKISFEEN